MGECVLWRGQEMDKAIKRHRTEIRFSPLSLLCLLFCWIGVSGLAFYLGILVGRMEQMREMRRMYRADESVLAEDELPPLSFEEALMLPEAEPEERMSSLSKSLPQESLSTPIAEGTSAEKKVLQIASFREPELAARLVGELREKGYRCFQAMSGPSGSGEAYCRVFVGPLPSSEMAEQVKERLEEQEGYEGILIRTVGKKEAKF